MKFRLKQNLELGLEGMLAFRHVYIHIITYILSKYSNVTRPHHQKVALQGNCPYLKKVQVDQVSAFFRETFTTRDSKALWWK